MSQKMIVRSFWSIFLVVYLIVGYVRHALFVRTEWAVDATLWDKIVSYYLSSFILNIVPAFVIALILGFVLNYYVTSNAQTHKRDNQPNIKGKQSKLNGNRKK